MTPNYAPEVRNSVVAAYYPRLTASPDTVRARAQAAYAIASTIAGGLVGASLLTNPANVSDLVKLLGGLALLVWLAAAGLYIFAVGSKVPDVMLKTVDDPNEFVHNIIEQTRKERKTIEWRLRCANTVAAAAAILTTLTFVFALENERGDQVDAIVTVDAATTGHLATACGAHQSTLTGDVSLRSLNSQYVDIQLTQGSCARLVRVFVPRAAVLSIQVRR